MKTKEQILADVDALKGEGNHTAIWVISVAVVCLFVRHYAQWISLHTNRTIGLAFYFIAEFGLLPVAIWRLWKIQALRKKTDFNCPNCGAPLIKMRGDLKKILNENKCPRCGQPVFIA